MPAVRILTLGAASVAPGSLSQQPKRLALLAYLAVANPRGPHRRDDLIALLWPEMSDERARSALRQALHGLRRSLGEDVIQNYGTELLDLNRTLVSCDLWELEAALDLAQTERVASLFHPELLRGLYVSEAPEFDRWIEVERRRLTDRVLQAYWQAAASASREERGACVQRAMTLCPHDELAIRRGMKLLSDDGNLPAAKALYDQFEARLRRDLELDVSEETRTFVAEISQQYASTSSRNAGVRMAQGVPQANPLSTGEPVSRDQSILEAAPIAAWGNEYGADAEPATLRESRQLRRRALYIGLAATMLATTFAGAAALKSRFGARDPRVISVVSEFGPATDSASRAQVFAATSAVRSAIASSNLFTVLDGTNTGRQHESRAGTVVRVGIDRISGEYSLTGSIVDVSGGLIRDGIRGPHLASADDAWRAGADKLASALALARYPGWARALSQPPSMAAYRAFVAGMEQIIREQHASAIALFLEAYRTDSSFTIAGLMAGAELMQSRHYASADSLARSIALRRSSLPEIDRLLLDWLQSSLLGNRRASFQAMREVVRLAPSAELAQLQAATEAAENGEFRLSLELFEKMRESLTPGGQWLAYWANRAEVLHMLGDHKRELRELRAALKEHPEMEMLRLYETRSLAAVLDTAPVWSRLQVLLETSNPSVPEMLRQVAQELRAHGDAPGAQRALQMARQWYATQRVDTSTTSYMVGVARVAYLQDDRQTARAMYERISERQTTTCIECLGARGVLAARENDTKEAARIDSIIARSSRPYLFGLHTLWRARIAATLGDVSRARILYAAAREEGMEIDVLSHADFDLRHLGDVAFGPVTARLTAN